MCVDLKIKFGFPNHWEVGGEISRLPGTRKAKFGFPNHWEIGGEINRLPGTRKPKFGFPNHLEIGGEKVTQGNCEHNIEIKLLATDVSIYFAFSRL